MKTLIWRLFKKSWVVQVALVILLASGVAVLAIYGSYLARETGAINNRIKTYSSRWDFLVTETAPARNTNLNASGRPIAFMLIAGWFNDVTPSNLGDLPISYIDLTFGAKSLAPTPGVVAVHAKIANRLGVKEGDTLTLFRQHGPIEVIITDVYTETPFKSGLDFGESIVVSTGEAQHNSYFLYQPKTTPVTHEQHMRNSIAMLHSKGSAIGLPHDNTMGNLLVQSNYAVISQARYTLMLFLLLAFLTAKLLGYLDNRKILAIIKALGLKKNELAATLGMESLISPVLGALLGGALSLSILYVLNSLGYGMSFSASIVVGAMLFIFPAVLPGILVPARLAQVSTVNELLFERPAAMFREQTSSLRSRHPGLDPLMEKGVHFLRLEVVDGTFEGFIFRKLGDKVQAGEVLALQHSWWGMKAKEYLSPITGTVVFFEDNTGIVGIGPQELLTKSEGETVGIPLPCRLSLVVGDGESS